MKKILASIMAVATLAGGMVTAAPAEARNRAFIHRGGGGHAFGGYHGHRNFGVAGRQGWSGNRYGWGGRHYRGGSRYGYYGRGYYRDNDNGDAIAAGVAGLAVGAIIGGALSQHHYRAGGSCSARFKSYNPATGTYLGYDGLRHSCP